MATNDAMAARSITFASSNAASQAFNVYSSLVVMFVLLARPSPGIFTLIYPVFRRSFFCEIDRVFVSGKPWDYTRKR